MGFVSLSDAADNVAGRPGGSAKWLPALMQQRLQREAGRSDECFSGKKKLKWNEINKQKTNYKKKKKRVSGASGFELGSPLCHCAAFANYGGPFLLTDGKCTVTPNQDSIFHPFLPLPPRSWLSVLNQKSRGWFSKTWLNLGKQDVIWPFKIHGVRAA